MKPSAPRIALLKLTILLIVMIPFLGTLIAMVFLWNRYVFWQDIALLGTFYALAMLGITIGYHRMLTHQGFQCSPWLRGFLLACGCMAFEGDPLDWAAAHIKHHAHSDEEDDPHSPLHGFWHAHLGWLFSPESYPNHAIYVPHLLRDPVVVFVSRYTYLWMALSLLIPFAIGGFTGLIWGGAVRIFLNTHVTWSVNSICHTFGRRVFETTDESRNQWLIGLLAFGEGWHNNHHAFPRNAFHGLQWYQFDLSGLLIRMLEKLGIIWEVQRIHEAAIEGHRVRTKGMMEMLASLRKELAERACSAKAELMATLQDRLSAALDERSVLAATVFCEEAVQRLEEIQRTLRRAQHLKKQRLLAYQREVDALLARAKVLMTTSIHLQEVSAMG